MKIKKYAFLLVCLLVFPVVTANCAMASILTANYAMASIFNKTYFYFKAAPGWSVLEGSLYGFSRPYADIGPHTYFTHQIIVSFDSTVGESQQYHQRATSTFDYYDMTDVSNPHKMGSCTFSFSTTYHAWAPSFVDSHCTGPVTLLTHHQGGGLSGDDEFLFYLE